MQSSPSRKLVLGSTSVYRRELLARLRLPFIVAAPDVDETPLPGEAPAALARRLALAKARAVADLHPECIVIGSDQVADLHGQPLGTSMEDLLLARAFAAWGDAFITGMLTAIFVAFRPHWLATYADRIYLPR